VQPASAESIRAFIDQMVDSFVSAKGPEEDLEGLHSLVMESVESRLIQMVLKKCHGNKARAAKILGLHRNTLAQKLASVTVKPTTLSFGGLRRSNRSSSGRV